MSLPPKKTQALLAYLAVVPGHAHPRDKLAALLWGETPEAEARASLRQALYTLRKAVPAGVLREGDAVGLEPAMVEVDVATFERAVAAGTPGALEEAGRLYQGDLLAGLVVKEAPGFEEWLLGERERLRELALEGLAKLLASQRSSGAGESAVQTALKLLTLDPLQEAVHRTLMRLYAQLGRRGAALRQYQACVAVLQRELAVEPEAETKQLYQALLRERAPARGGGPPAVVRVEVPVAETPLVARDEELRRLRAALAEVAQGHGRLAVVLGEAGIGKSRLVAELAADAALSGARVLVGRSYESEQILAFGPWVDAFRTARLTATTDPLDRFEPVWRAEVARLLPEIGVEPPASPVEHRTLFEAVGRLVAGLAAGSPVLLVLEDLHWADEMSCRLLAFIGRRLSEWPVLVAATAREEELPDAPAFRAALDELEREGKLATLALGPLSRAGTAELVRSLARAGSDTGAIDRLGEQVWAASEGNPLMAVETLRALREGEHTVPARVREVVTRRLDRLGAHAQQVAAVAAVIGREFDFGLLERAAGLGEEAAAQGTEELVRRRVLHGVGERFDFTHDRIREVAYGRLLSPRRKLLHHRIAEALEARRAADPDVEALALGLHYRQAEVWDKAVEYLQQAGQRAHLRGAYREAASCLEQALSALGHLPESRQRLELAYDITAEVRGAVIPVGDLQRQVEALREMEAIAQTLGDRRRLAHVLTSAIYTTGALGDHVGAIDFAKRARALAEELGDFPGQVGADAMMGRACYALGQYPRTIEVAGRAFAALPGKLAYERFGRPSMLQAVGARIWVAMALAEQGEFAHATARVAEAIRIADTDQGTHERVWARFGAGRVALVQGDLERAVSLLEPVLPLARRDLGIYISRIASTLGAAHLLAGRPAEALALLEEAAEHGKSIGFMHGHSLVLALLAEGYHHAGRPADARRTADEALELARKLGERGWEAWTLRALGEITGDPARYGAALALADELGMRPLQAHCRLGLGRVTGDRAAVASAVDAYRALDMPFWVSRAELPS